MNLRGVTHLTYARSCATLLYSPPYFTLPYSYPALLWLPDTIAVRLLGLSVELEHPVLTARKSSRDRDGRARRR